VSSSRSHFSVKAPFPSEICPALINQALKNFDIVAEKLRDSRLPPGSTCFTHHLHTLINGIDVTTQAANTGLLSENGVTFAIPLKDLQYFVAKDWRNVTGVTLCKNKILPSIVEKDGGISSTTYSSYGLSSDSIGRFLEGTRGASFLIEPFKSKNLVSTEMPVISGRGFRGAINWLAEGERISSSEVKQSFIYAVGVGYDSRHISCAAHMQTKMHRKVEDDGSHSHEDEHWHGSPSPAG
jgi:hypothetical protein